MGHSIAWCFPGERFSVQPVPHRWLAPVPDLMAMGEWSVGFGWVAGNNNRFTTENDFSLF